LASSGFALFLVFFGSWLQKMIGVEFINSLQIVYFLTFSIIKYTSTFNSLRKLSFIGLSLLSVQRQTQTFSLSPNFQREVFSMKTAEYMLAGCALCIVIVGGLYAVLHLIAHHYR
jgi:hypothetical protein